MANKDLNRKILDLEFKIKTLGANYAKHQHDGFDGTNQLRKSIKNR